jgi:transposase-like protein
MSEEKAVCPRCGSDLVVKLANQSHCNNCAEDFQIDRFPIASAAAKRQAERSVRTGYYTTRNRR